MQCSICDSTDTHLLSSPRRDFFCCGTCGFIQADPSSRLEPALARERYERHQNTIENTGYVSYLESIIDRTLARIPVPVKSILDWGSGPRAVSAELLTRRGYAVSIWDPHFAPIPRPREQFFDLIFCIEVAEHFETPRTDFASLARCLLPGGTLAVHTHPVPEGDAAFLRWWYAEDLTHVSFYNRNAMAVLASLSGLNAPEYLDDKLALFLKKDAP